MAELVAYPQQQFEANPDAWPKDAETKEIGGRAFQVYCEEYTIFEKPRQVPYLLWHYLFQEGELCFRITFFQNQEEPQLDTAEFEELLQTAQVAPTQAE